MVLSLLFNKRLLFVNGQAVCCISVTIYIQLQNNIATDFLLSEICCTFVFKLATCAFNVCLQLSNNTNNNNKHNNYEQVQQNSS